MKAPLADREIIGEGKSGSVNSSPNTTDANTKHFERNGWEIVEISAAEIPNVSNDRKDTAFLITDTHDPLEGTIRASDPIAVFGRKDDDTTIGLGDYFDGSGKLMQVEDRAGGSEVRGIELDVNDDGKGAKWTINKDCTMRDVTVRGEQDGSPGTKWAAGIYIGGLNHGEEVTLRNVNQPNGAARTSGVPSHNDSIGVILGGSCDGNLRMVNCTVGGFGNNGVYASGPEKQNNDGKAIIKNHTGYNSDRDQLRVGSDSVIENCTLYANRQKPDFDNLRGIWARFSRGVEIRNNTIRTFPGSDPGEAIRVDSTAARTIIKNNEIELRGDHKAARGICAYSPDEDARDSGADIVVEGNHFHGNATNLRDVILVKSGRGGSTLRNNNINVPGAEEEIDFRK